MSHIYKSGVTIMRNLMFVSILFLWCPFALATNFVPGHILQSGDVLVISGSNIPLPGSLFLLAENTQDTKTEPEPGALVIPGEESDKVDKKCLTVCKKWGEDCIINPRTGARNCRRTCKDFGKECF